MDNHYRYLQALETLDELQKRLNKLEILKLFLCKQLVIWFLTFYVSGSLLFSSLLSETFLNRIFLIDIDFDNFTYIILFIKVFLILIIIISFIKLSNILFIYYFTITKISKGRSILKNLSRQISDYEAEQNNTFIGEVLE